MKTAYFSGFNGFRQFGNAHGRKVNMSTELSPDWSDHGFLQYAFSWSFNVRSTTRSIIISGFVAGLPNNEKTFEVSDDIKSISTSDDRCLVLLINGDLYEINVNLGVMVKMNFVRTERPFKRSALGEAKPETSSVIDPIELIACGKYISVAITKSNAVYNIPSKIFDFPKHVKVRKLICGFEHAMVLTSNGDIYTWGNGIRGQLGHSELKVVETPTLLDALAGVRILSIAAGGWHSAAISSFGDLYVWGSNINGQLGIPLRPVSSRGAALSSQRKNPSIYYLPQLIDFETCCNRAGNHSPHSSCNSTQVVCGARHTIVKNDCGKIHFAGWNEHGQSGFDAKNSMIDKFTPMKLPFPSVKAEMLCGPWCSVFVVEHESNLEK